MTPRNNPKNRRAGFTLIELLTVVAIISLLIGILLPSLARARDQAKAAKILAMLSSIEKALEMFHNDFGQYPESSIREDPIDWEDEMDLDNQTPLSGAHWLARALVGPDFNGVDVEGLCMRQWGDFVSVPQPTISGLRVKQRRPVYFEASKNFYRDNDSSAGLSLINNTTDFASTGRMIVIDDAFRSPILYYRANERASNPFCLDGAGTEAPGSTNDAPGVYRLRDNGGITGDAANNVKGWDFGSAGRQHWLAIFGVVNPANPQDINQPVDAKNTFARYLHNPNALSTANVIRPVKADGFILISAGKDGLYGTDDDINNFNTAR